MRIKCNVIQDFFLKMSNCSSHSTPNIVPGWAKNWALYHEETLFALSRLPSWISRVLSHKTLSVMAFLKLWSFLKLSGVSLSCTVVDLFVCSHQVWTTVVHSSMNIVRSYCWTCSSSLPPTMITSPLPKFSLATRLPTVTLPWHCQMPLEKTSSSLVRTDMFPITFRHWQEWSGL